MESKHCLNCDANLVKAQNFCAKCGQPASTHRFTLASFFHEGFHAITHADKGLFYLLKELLLKPGLVAREYIGGKRKKYFNPFTFFLLLMGFFVFVNTFVKSNYTTADKSIPIRISSIKDPQIKASSEIQYQRGIVARDFMTKHGNLVAMCAIPFFAFFFWSIYYRREYNYSEHLVANLMFVTLANLAFTLIVFPLQGILTKPWSLMMPLVGLLLQVFYFTIAYKGFMQLNGFWAVMKVTFFSVMGIVLWSMFSISCIAMYVYRNIHFYEYFKYMNR